MVAAARQMLDEIGTMRAMFERKSGGAEYYISVPSFWRVVNLVRHASCSPEPICEWRDVRMVESIVELFGGLFLSAMALLIGSWIVGSVVAALRAISPGN
jgi:hypothetical protein